MPKFGERAIFAWRGQAKKYKSATIKATIAGNQSIHYLADLYIRSIGLRIRLSTWVLEEPRRIGRPNIKLRAIIQEKTGLEGKDLVTAMQDQDSWQTKFVQRFY